MGIKLVIDDDKNVDLLKADVVARTAHEGFQHLIKGNVDVLYLDHYLDGLFLGSDLIMDFLYRIEDERHLPKEIYFISSELGRNKSNSEIVNEVLTMRGLKSRYEIARTKPLPINGTVRAVYICLTDMDNTEGM